MRLASVALVLLVAACEGPRFEYGLGEVLKETGGEGAWEPTQVERFTWSPGRRLQSRIVQRFRGDVWKDQSRVTYAWDEEGRLLSATESIVVADAFLELVRTTYGWDEAGRLASSDVEERPGDRWLPADRSEFAYDERGRLVAITEAHWDEDVLQLRRRTELAWNTDGRVGSVTAFAREGAAWKALQRRAYTWDGARLKSDVRQDARGDVFEDASRVLFNHDDLGVTDYRVQRWDGAWGDELAATAQRAQGRVTYTFRRLVGDTWTESSRVTYSLTDAGDSAFWEGAWNVPAGELDVTLAFGEALP